MEKTKVNDMYGIINAEGERELTLQKICDIIGVPVPENLMAVKDEISDYAATKAEYGKEGCFFFRITEIGSKTETIRRWHKQILPLNCRAVFVDRDQYEEEGLQDIDLPWVPVDNIIERTGKFFSYMKDLNGVKTLAVTGTCGKTTTMRFLKSILPNHFNMWANDGNANSYMAVSRHIMDKLSPENEVYLQETGAALRDSIKKSATMLTVDAFVLLNVFNHHINEYKTQEAILEDKASFDEYMKDGGVAVVNYDDDLIAAYEFKHDIITFGIETERQVDYRAVNIAQHGEVLELDIVYGDKTVHVKTSILGEHNAYNALAAFALCKHMGVSDEDIVAGFAGYESKGFRQRFWYLGGYNLLIDAYNLCEDSLKANLKTIRSMDVEDGKKKIAVITGENKLGEDAYNISYKLGQELELDGIDHLVVVGPAEETQENIDYYCHGRALYEGIVAGGYENAVYVTNPADMETAIRNVISEGDLILFKGMYNMDLTPVIDRIFGSRIAMNNPYYKKQADDVENSEYKAMKYPVLESLEIRKAKKKNKVVVIPDSIDGYPVHSLKKALFKGKTYIEKLDLGHGIRNLGRATFEGCTGLKKVRIPANVQVIGQETFRNCTNLKKVVIEKGVTHIEAEAFKGCSSLKRIKIPATVKFVDPTAFDSTTVVKKKM